MNKYITLLIFLSCLLLHGFPVMWTFEPSAALQVYQQMLAEEKVQVVYEERLNRQSGVKKEGYALREIEMESGKIYHGKVFIDATYEGDLRAAEGVSYTVGRESNQQYRETLTLLLSYHQRLE